MGAPQVPAAVLRPHRAGMCNFFCGLCAICCCRCTSRVPGLQAAATDAPVLAPATCVTKLHVLVVPLMQLVYTFPEDAKTSTGALFWSPPKR